jgi:hypothetical protein
LRLVERRAWSNGVVAGGLVKAARGEVERAAGDP